MLKIIVLLYFLAATVTGEMQVQNTGHDQLVQSNAQSPAEQALAYRIAHTGPTQRKPCQGRRKVETLNGQPPVPVTILRSTKVYPINHKIPRDTNNNGPLKSHVPSDFESLLLTENEQKPKQDYQRANVNDDYYLCQDVEDLKPSAGEVQKEAIKLINKCVQDSKNPGFEVPSRRSFDPAPQIEVGGSSGFNVPVNDDVADVRGGDALLSNNDYDASLPNIGLLRPNPAAVSENHDLSEFNFMSRKSGDLLHELQHPVLINFAPNVSGPHPANARVCYACSSVNDPTCWTPNEHTNVKYCLQDHKCLSKTIQTPKEQPIVIRDCGSKCDADSVPGILPVHKTCHVCDTDLCNSAAAIDNLNILLATFLMAAFKYAL